jgi:hypothetical protein
VPGDTGHDPLITRETVAVETPATRATSMIVVDGELLCTELNPRCLHLTNIVGPLLILRHFRSVLHAQAGRYPLRVRS